MDTITLTLSVNEAQFVLNTLGELPSKSGVWPLIVKIKEQADQQVNSMPAAPAQPSA
jgi:hypothetical protein